MEECGIRSADDLESITLQLLKGTTADVQGELKFAEIFNYHEQTTGESPSAEGGWAGEVT